MSRCLYGQLGTMNNNRTRPGRPINERVAPRIKIADYDRVMALNGDRPWNYANAMSTVLHELTNFIELWKPEMHNRGLRNDMQQRIAEKYRWLADEATFKTFAEMPQVEQAA